MPQVNPDSDGNAGRGAEDDAVGAADHPIALVDASSPGESVVIVNDHGGAAIPAAADLHPRLTPVGIGLDGDSDVFWVVSEHGARCDYVKNLIANPDVPLTTVPSGGFQQRERSRCNPEGAVRAGPTD